MMEAKHRSQGEKQGALRNTKGRSDPKVTLNSTEFCFSSESRGGGGTLCGSHAKALSPCIACGELRVATSEAQKCGNFRLPNLPRWGGSPVLQEESLARLGAITTPFFYHSHLPGFQTCSILLGQDWAAPWMET